VSRFFYGEPFHRTSYRLPEKFHETDLGKLVNEAMLRFYQEERPGQLLTMKDMQQLFGVSRQAVHGWIRDGDILPVWVKNTTRFYRKDVDRLIEKQQKMPFTGKFGSPSILVQDELRLPRFRRVLERES
jgi:predicted DNA-binding transcriptional regulator AlpA